MDENNNKDEKKYITKEDIKAKEEELRNIELGNDFEKISTSVAGLKKEITKEEISTPVPLFKILGVLVIIIIIYNCFIKEPEDKTPVDDNTTPNTNINNKNDNKDDEDITIKNDDTDKPSSSTNPDDYLTEDGEYKIPSSNTTQNKATKSN